MKVPCLTARCVTRLTCLTFSLFALLAVGAQTGHAQVTDGVRVIDIKYIFEHHTRYRATVDGLKKEFEVAAARVQEERKAIIQAEAQLKELQPGSPDFKRMDEDLARRKAEWKIQGDKQLKEFQARQSEINWNVYYELTLAVQEYSKQNNIGLVLQFNGDQPNSRTPQGIAQAISRNIVFVAENRDITPVILQMCNRGAAPAPAPVNNLPVSVPGRR